MLGACRLPGRRGAPCLPARRITGARGQRSRHGPPRTQDPLFEDPWSWRLRGASSCQKGASALQQPSQRIVPQTQRPGWLLPRRPGLPVLSPRQPAGHQGRPLPGWRGCQFPRAQAAQEHTLHSRHGPRQSRIAAGLGAHGPLLGAAWAQLPPASLWQPLWERGHPGATCVCRPSPEETSARPTVPLVSAQEGLVPAGGSVPRAAWPSGPFSRPLRGKGIQSAVSQ